MKIKLQKIFVISLFALILCAIFWPAPKSAFALEVTYPRISTPAGQEQITDQTPLTEYLKYIFDIGIFVGFFIVVLTLVYAGALYFLSPVLPNAKAEIKDRVSGAISALLILALLYLIITTINPSLAFFRLQKVQPVSTPKGPAQADGIYFYTKNPDNTKNIDCSGAQPIPNTSSLADLGDSLRNKVNSIGIVQNQDDYIAILYSSINFNGACALIDPNKECSALKILNDQPIADSASIYKYTDNPSGNGVTFYRKSNFDSHGGWFFVSNSQINPYNIYSAKLSDLRFKNVPTGEQDCVNWDKNGNCDKRQPPDLSGENITSIKIDGNYVVLLVYYDKNDQGEEYYWGPWAFCQPFPTPNDVNKTGPTQIKWEAVRQAGHLPNYVLIFPVAQK